MGLTTHTFANLLHHGETMLGMQDISNWQGEKPVVVDHEILAIKATEGNWFNDPEFGDNWAFAKAHEKARLAYHFFHPSVPALQQAQFFLEQIDRFGLESGDLLAIDAEVADGMTPAVVDQGVKEFCDYVESQTKANPFVYTNLFFANAGNLMHCGNRPLWIADPSSPPGRPRIPEPWETWTAHQIGIVRGVDADVVNATSVEELIRYGALVGPPTPPPNTVVMTLKDGTGAEYRHDFHEATPLAALKGAKYTAGDSILEFSE